MVFDMLEGKRNTLGRLGENQARTARFLIRSILYEFPGATITLLNKRKGDAAAYPVNGQYLDLSGVYLLWTIQSGDLTADGDGECELIAMENGKIVKSVIYETFVDRALDGSGTPPDPWKSWQEQVAEDAAKAEDAVEHYPKIVGGYWYVWDVENETWVSTGEKAQGEQGDPGFSPVVTVTDITDGHHVNIEDESGDHGFDVMDGDPGFSPVVAVKSISGGHEVTITDEQGDHEFDVMDGFSPVANVTKSGKTTTITITDESGTTSEEVTDGDDGFSPVITVTDITGGHRVSITDSTGTSTVDVMDGVDGNDGVSPTVTITDITGGHTVTITDKNGSHAFNVMDGDPATIIDDTAGSGDTDKTWSADKLSGEVDNLQEQIDKKANAIYKVIEDTAIASFSDGADNMPVKECVIAIEPVQDLHGQDAPYPAGGGVNKFGDYTVANAYIGSDGTLIANNNDKTYIIPIQPSTGYAIKIKRVVATGVTNNDDVQVGEYYGESRPVANDVGAKLVAGGYVNNVYTSTFTTSANAKWLAIKLANTTKTDAEATASTVQVEVGSSVSENYSPYSNICPITGWTGANVSRTNGKEQTDPDYVRQIYPISWQDSAGTVYGGSLNLNTGMLTVDKISITFDGSDDEGWAKYGTQTEQWQRQSWRASILPHNISLRTSAIYGCMTSSIPLSTTAELQLPDENNGITCRSTYYVSKHFYIFTPLSLNWEVQDMKNMLSATPVQFVYPIETPITYQLTPVEIRTLLASNTLFADCGNILSLIYPVDTKTYVDENIPDVSGFYTKPSGGIPKTDLASAVQTSLGKADTAYQKPVGGIPLTDIASNVNTVSGTTPSITGVAGNRYICGEVATLSITAPTSGIIDVVFESGSTATVLTVTSAKSGVTAIKWANGFDPTALDANTTYELNILDGEFGVVGKWT